MEDSAHVRAHVSAHVRPHVSAQAHARDQEHRLHGVILPLSGPIMG